MNGNANTGTIVLDYGKVALIAAETGVTFQLVQELLVAAALSYVRAELEQNPVEFGKTSGVIYTLDQLAAEKQDVLEAISSTVEEIVAQIKPLFATAIEKRMGFSMPQEQRNARLN